MAIVEGEKYKQLLTQLADRNQDVDPNLLLAPKSRTRPEIRLVASYNWKWQFAITDFSWGQIVGQTTVVLGSWYTLGEALARENSGEIKNSILKVIAMAVSADRSLPFQLGIVAGLLLLVLLTSILRGKLSIVLGRLDFDLNGLYHFAPKGRCFTSWSQIMSVLPDDRFNNICLSQENGDYLSLWMPKTDHQNLTELIKRLIVRHQSDDLIGKTGPGSGV